MNYDVTEREKNVVGIDRMLLFFNLGKLVFFNLKFIRRAECGQYSRKIFRRDDVFVRIVLTARRVVCNCAVGIRAACISKAAVVRRGGERSRIYFYYDYC